MQASAVTLLWIWHVCVSQGSYVRSWVSSGATLRGGRTFQRWGLVEGHGIFFWGGLLSEEIPAVLENSVVLILMASCYYRIRSLPGLYGFLCHHLILLPHTLLPWCVMWLSQLQRLSTGGCLTPDSHSQHHELNKALQKGLASGICYSNRREAGTTVCGMGSNGCLIVFISQGKTSRPSLQRG